MALPFMTIGYFSALLIAAAAGSVLLILLSSFYTVGPTEVGLVRKKFGAKLPGDNPVATQGEAGYQAEMLMPGLRFKLCLVYAVTKHPWVQVPAGQIGVVIAQVGRALPMGAKSAMYKTEFGNFADLERLHREGRPEGRSEARCLSPGTLAPIHPVAFLVITQARGVRRSRFRRSERAGAIERPPDAPRFRPGRESARSHADLAAPDRRRQSRRHDRHRHDARRTAAAGGRHRQPAGRICGYRGVGGGRDGDSDRRRAG